MEINKAIQIIEDNFRLNSDDYIKLLGMLQELQQYRENARRGMDNATDPRKQFVEMATT